MKITYDKNADAMLILWNESAEYGKNVKIQDGYEFMLILDKDGKPIGVEILYVSDSVAHPELVHYENITRPEPEQKPSVPK